ncbi:amidohydrolase family protein [Dactylosporangium sp. NPDC051485]|uniref:amidohydrolase family protein n=1 Tax=Dactylosporangium sp. NPDC051485 TaxID=3154846 RepID=UPI0034266140
MIDWHSHMLSPDLTPPSGAVGLWPGVASIGDGFQLTRGGRAYRAADRTAFDSAERIRRLDQIGVDLQVLSPPPLVLNFAGPADEFRELARQQNAFLAGVAGRHPDRFRVLGMLPYGEPAGALREVKRLEGYGGVVGVCVVAGAHDEPLTSPEFADVWSRVAARGWTVFVHPDAAAVSDCDRDDPFALGMPAATGRTAVRMLACGLLDGPGAARVLLAHAGGILPAILDRLDVSWRAGRIAGTVAPTQRIRANVWVDSVAYGEGPLSLAVAALGRDRLVYGSDFPFAAQVSLGDLSGYGDRWLELVAANGASLLDAVTGR